MELHLREINYLQVKVQSEVKGQRSKVRDRFNEVNLKSHLTHCAFNTELLCRVAAETS